MAGSAADFITRKGAQWEREREREKVLAMKDADRMGTRRWVRYAWTFWPQSNLPGTIGLHHRAPALRPV